MSRPKPTHKTKFKLDFVELLDLAVIFCLIAVVLEFAFFDRNKSKKPEKDTNSKQDIKIGIWRLLWSSLGVFALIIVCIIVLLLLGASATTLVSLTITFAFFDMCFYIYKNNNLSVNVITLLKNEGSVEVILKFSTLVGSVAGLLALKFGPEIACSLKRLHQIL